MQTATARFNMIEQQIRTWDVLDPTVLQLLNDVPREKFVPKEYAGLAFADIEIPIGYDADGVAQTMLSPKLEGRILQALNVQKHHTVLHIGTGSGYFAALLASLAKKVTSIDINADLSEIAGNNIAAQGLQNIKLVVTDGAQGYLINDGIKKDHTQHNNVQHNNLQHDSKQNEDSINSYDVIVYTASSPIEPVTVRQQLNIGGVLFVIIGTAPVMQAKLISRVIKDSFKETILFETSLQALTNAAQAKAFVF